MPFVNNSYSSYYTGQTVGPQSYNSYASLGGYNNCFKGIQAPVPATTVTGYYIVPQWNSPGYSTLQRGNQCPTGANYFQIGQAYGGDGGCDMNTKYMARLCQ